MNEWQHYSDLKYQSLFNFHWINLLQCSCFFQVLWYYFDVKCCNLQRNKQTKKFWVKQDTSLLQAQIHDLILSSSFFLLKTLPSVHLHSLCNHKITTATTTLVGNETTKYLKSLKIFHVLYIFLLLDLQADIFIHW